MQLAFFLGVLVFAWFFLYKLGKVAPAEAHRLVADDGARLIDVRTREEFASGHIEGAENIPLDELAAKLEGIRDAKRPVVVYCASGVRSAGAKRRLVGGGVKDVHDLGAMKRW